MWRVLIAVVCAALAPIGPTWTGDDGIVSPRAAMAQSVPVMEVIPERVEALSSGPQLLVDTRIETPAQNDNERTLVEMQAGDSIEFQMFAPGAAGVRIQGYTIELALRGKTFGSYIDNVSGVDFNGNALISRTSGTGNPTLSMLSVSGVTIPANGYLGQVDMKVSRALTSSDALMVRSAQTAGAGGVQDLDVSQASLTFTAVWCPGDFNGDGMVNLADFLAFAGGFGTRSGDAGYNARLDMDGSGSIDLLDFLLFAGAFGTTCATPPPPAASQDRDVLVALYNATDGANWRFNTNWLSDRPLGEWYGVTADGNGRVTRLRLYAVATSSGDTVGIGSGRGRIVGNGLIGRIPSQLGSLSNLRELDLPRSQLRGEIPAALGNLSNLTRLSLYANQLSGEIPSELGNLSNLVNLNLHGNQLSGEVPAALGNLSNLQWLYLRENQLSGEIPTELGSLSNLRDLWLDENQLSGEIPTELGSLSNLSALSLFENQLSGEIPPRLGSLSNLQWLYLRENQLSGEIPTELGSLSNLTVLLLSNNTSLSGALPASFTGLDNLVTLRVDGTGLCAPTDTAFQTWLQGVENKRGVVNCAPDGGGSGKMYWADYRTDKIQRANLDGSGVEDLVTSGLAGPYGIALDPGSRKMFWTDQWANKIQRANLDGSGVEDLITGTSGIESHPVDIALDVGAGKMYWAETSTIRRANLDGSAVEVLVTGLVGPLGMALDLGAGKMYWGEHNPARIRRANLGGSGVEDLVGSGEMTGRPLGMALDLGAGKMYWLGGNTIQRANLGGSGVEDLVTVGHSQGIALDPGGGKIYWTDDGRDKIQRANLDGSGVEDLVISGLISPYGIALDTGTGDGRIFDGTPIRLTNNNVIELSPAWSPDGRQIAFLSGDEADEPDQLWVMDADGSNSMKLTASIALPNDYYIPPPVWSPDGATIAFSSNRDGNFEIYSMDADGANSTRLTNDDVDGYFAAWSPDGTRIAFWSRHASGNGGDIYVMKADGGNVTRLTRYDVEDDFWLAPVWSPDGTEIAFRSAHGGVHDGQIYVTNADGTGTRRLTNGVAREAFPAWSPDGTKIAFITEVEGNVEIYVIAVIP